MRYPFLDLKSKKASSRKRSTLDLIRRRSRESRDAWDAFAGPRGRAHLHRKRGAADRPLDPPSKRQHESGRPARPESERERGRPGRQPNRAGTAVPHRAVEGRRDRLRREGLHREEDFERQGLQERGYRQDVGPERCATELRGFPRVSGGPPIPEPVLPLPRLFPS